MTPRPIRICMVSVHGLIRSENLELGRDADTGGQTRYVVELARALGERDDVASVELLTRRVVDSHVSADYAQRTEPIGPDSRIVRIDAGPEHYLLKEKLWDVLDDFVDAAEAHLRSLPELPDVVHGHYADAGYVAMRLARRLDIPCVHTGHSLGRIKRQRLVAHGLGDEVIEKTYCMSRRIQAEEDVLEAADAVITSTQQEIEDQWGRYENHDARRMHVIPPGTDLARFHPPRGDEWNSRAANELRRFLPNPHKPIVLVVARPDPRKNLVRQVEAFASDPVLRERANLVVIAGTRIDIDELDAGPTEVLTELLMAIDRQDLYGRVAYPKDLAGDDIPMLYRLAAATHGVHVNAALTEPFGLTLLEAAASGLPVVATNDGGPRDILARCNNGVLVDPLRPASIADGIKSVLLDFEAWNTASASGLAGVRKYFTWKAHAQSYVDLLRDDVLAHPMRSMPSAPPTPVVDFTSSARRAVG